MLAVWDDLPDSYFQPDGRNASIRRQVEFRKSQYKFGIAVPYFLEVCEWSRPLTYYTNRNIIMLLNSLGVEDETLVQFQRDYLRDVDKMVDIDMPGGGYRTP